MDWVASITRWYQDGLWTAEMVAHAVEKGKLTQAQADEILTPSVDETETAQAASTKKK